MTLTLAWVRKVGDAEELVLASDSRLRCGEAWDACPKLLLTARGDLVLGFAGETIYAYPLMLQAANHVSLHRASRIRQLDIHRAKGHLKRIFHGMLDFIGDLPMGNHDYEPPDTTFVLAGYSWRKRAFAIWSVRYDAAQRSFVWQACGGLQKLGAPNQCAILGAPSLSDKMRREIEKAGKIPKIARGEDVRILAATRIARIIKDRGGLKSPGLDMEPFEVLRDMIREQASPHVGGPPQIVKIHLFCNSTPIGVLWPNRDAQRVAVLGRTLLEYERLDCPVLDPDSLECGAHLWPQRDR